MKKTARYLAVVLGILVIGGGVYLAQQVGPTPSQDIRASETAATRSLAVPTASTEAYLPMIASPSTPTGTPTQGLTASQGSVREPTRTYVVGPTGTAEPSELLESFESSPSNWRVSLASSGGGQALQTAEQVLEGQYAALLTTSSSAANAQVEVQYSDPAGQHSWGERPGTWVWQRNAVYLPSGTVQQLGADEYFTLAGFWPSAGGAYGWWLRVHQGGLLSVYGYDADGNAHEFLVYGVFPQDRWVDLTLGLHSQNGAGVKRAFAFLVDGDFYGWYHQGHMQDETYDRVGVGVLSTNSKVPLSVYVDRWYSLAGGLFPPGPDTRLVGPVVEMDYTRARGVQWQIDWSTWGLDLVLDPAVGLYSAGQRLQSGINLDRMPDLTSGWAEIEIGWPGNAPNPAPEGYFGPMVGFRKEINREENLEVIPIGRGGGAVDLVLEAWVNGGPVELVKWALPTAQDGATHIPEAGDRIRVRWEQLDAVGLRVDASYYDASQAVWNQHILLTTIDVTNVSGVDFTDGFHGASSITIDSPEYSILRFTVGTLETYP